MTKTEKELQEFEKSLIEKSKDIEKQYEELEALKKDFEEFIIKKQKELQSTQPQITISQPKSVFKAVAKAKKD